MIPLGLEGRSMDCGRVLRHRFPDSAWFRCSALHIHLYHYYLQCVPYFLRLRWKLSIQINLSGIISKISAADTISTPGDSGYWIEGPTGEDIRSIWRGQPVHVLVVDALLHPRATNLPPHVQTAYIQSAMKVRFQPKKPESNTSAQSC